MPFSPVRIPTSSLISIISLSPHLIFRLTQRWLLEKGRDDEARQAFYSLHGISTPEDEAAAERAFLTMQESIKAEVVVRSRRLSDLWATRAMMRRTLVAVGVQVFGQFSGINGEWRNIQAKSLAANRSSLLIVINYFGPTMYKSLGLNPSQSLLVQGIYGAVGPITNFLYVPSKTEIPINQHLPLASLL